MIALLTTKTTHHIYFENQIFKKYQNLITITETKLIKPNFRSNIFFEKKEKFLKKKNGLIIKNIILIVNDILLKILMTKRFLAS